MGRTCVAFEKQGWYIAIVHHLSIVEKVDHQEQVPISHD